MAQAPCILFLDDDDALRPNALVLLHAALASHPGAGMAFGLVNPVAAGPGVEAAKEHFKWAAAACGRLQGRSHLLGLLLFRRSVLLSSACMLRASSFHQVAGYNPSIPLCEGVELHARVVASSGYVHVPIPVVDYRVGHVSLMSQNASPQAMGQSYRRIQRAFARHAGLVSLLHARLWAAVDRLLEKHGAAASHPGARSVGPGVEVS